MEEEGHKLRVFGGGEEYLRERTRERISSVIERVVRSEVSCVRSEYANDVQKAGHIDFRTRSESKQRIHLEQLQVKLYLAHALHEYFCGVVPDDVHRTGILEDESHGGERRQTRLDRMERNHAICDDVVCEKGVTKHTHDYRRGF